MKFITPKRLPETNIQAEVYHLLRKNDIDCCLEYKVDDCIFDIVVISNKSIVCIIEVKSYKTNKPPKRSTKQIKKYEKYGIPILMISRMENVDQLFDEILDILTI